MPGFLAQLLVGAEQPLRGGSEAELSRMIREGLSHRAPVLCELVKRRCSESFWRAG